MTKRILIIEDDKAIARLLRDNLEYEGFLVETCENGRHALAAVKRFTPDLLLLDIMLPHGVDGFEICRSLNESPNRIPVIILSARGQKEDRIRGLTLGADDYVTKPFGMEELLARLRAAMRRVAQPGEPVRQIGELRVDLEKHAVSMAGEAVQLTPHEYALLRLLATNEGKLLTHAVILREVWGPRYGEESHYLHVYVSQLRRKIEPDPTRPRYILTEPGAGYRLVDPTA
jgi:two-component system KDP operon response regulator KdpE